MRKSPISKEFMEICERKNILTFTGVLPQTPVHYNKNSVTSIDLTVKNNTITSCSISFDIFDSISGCKVYSVVCLDIIRSLPIPTHWAYTFKKEILDELILFATERNLKIKGVAI